MALYHRCRALQGCLVHSNGCRSIRELEGSKKWVCCRSEGWKARVCNEVMSVPCLPLCGSADDGLLCSHGQKIERSLGHFPSFHMLLLSFYFFRMQRLGKRWMYQTTRGYVQMAERMILGSHVLCFLSLIPHLCFINWTRQQQMSRKFSPEGL